MSSVQLNSCEHRGEIFIMIEFFHFISIKQVRSITYRSYHVKEQLSEKN